MESDSSAWNISNNSEVSVNVSVAHIQKLVEDKSKARNYIKSCKNIIKRQNDQIKKQQAEFKNAMSALETQSFTTRFHSVAFRLELDVMKLINIRRRFDVVCKKKYFLQFTSQINSAKCADYYKLRGTYAFMKQSAESIVRYIKSNKKSKLRLGFDLIQLQALSKNPNSIKGRLEVLKKENMALKASLKDPIKNTTLNELLEENKKLKEKLKSTEQNVGNFIKEMGNLLSSHEPPGFAYENESLRPATKGKKGKKSKNRIPIMSPDRIEFPKKHKTTRVNFD
ncbi:hypothetical protein SteCoe_37488 [Stentor coeruleus]|uniref:Uncharacterized protein n=1 Tax=Stentor coeruleus TaxID=5963 RepID=A0A1R2AMX1_9CILI|nr:hypothetical protein SteCoe_37488 [Stentor coeruleus]